MLAYMAERSRCAAPAESTEHFIMTIKDLVDGDNSTASRVFDYSIQILIVVSLICFSLETLPDLSEKNKTLLNAAEVFLVIVFTIEYLLRVFASKPRRKFIFSFFGIVDLLSILPFYLSLGIDLRHLRALRLIRLVRTLKLARYSKAARRIHRAILIAKEEIILYLFFTMILLFLSSVGIYYFENEVQPDVFSSVFHSLWWSVTTLTTVGYGDAYPITAGGRIFTFLVLIIGLGVVAVPAGLVSSALSLARQMED